MAGKEILSPYDGTQGTVPELTHTARAFSPIEALMSAGPHQDPERSQLELLALRDVLADALDELEPKERRLVEARVIERRSFRSLERELGWTKSTIQRRERQLMARLAEMLQNHPIIKEYLGR